MAQKGNTSNVIVGFLIKISAAGSGCTIRTKLSQAASCVIMRSLVAQASDNDVAPPLYSSEPGTSVATVAGAVDAADARRRILLGFRADVPGAVITDPSSATACAGPHRIASTASAGTAGPVGPRRPKPRCLTASHCRQASNCAKRLQETSSDARHRRRAGQSPETGPLFPPN